MDLQTIREKYGSKGSAYRLMIPEITAEASQIMFDLFNASGSNKTMIVTAIYGVPKGDVAVVGAVSIRVDVFRTSAVGTGGTTATSDGSASNAGTIVKIDTGDSAVPAEITARKEPTGGATADDWLSTAHLFSEETNTALYLLQNQDILRSRPIVIRQGQGVSVVQGSVASVNNYSFIVDFLLI